MEVLVTKVLSKKIRLIIAYYIPITECNLFVAPGYRVISCLKVTAKDVRKDR